MSGYLLTPRAQADLDEIWLYVAQNRQEAADRLIDRIVGHFALLSANPGIGQQCSHLAKDLRRSTIGNYAVLYRPRPSRLEIIRIIHGARDIPTEFHRHWPEE